jgi:Major Facilitator Superfamily
VGLPGLLLAPLWLATVREPPRKGSVEAVSAVTVAAAYRHVKRHKRYFLLFYVVLGISGLGSYSFISWGPTVLVRSYGLSVADAGYYYGTIGLAGALVATIAWPTLSKFAVACGRPQATLEMVAAGLGLGHAAIASLRLIDDSWGAAAAIAVATFGFGTGGTLCVLTIQAASPAGMRAKLTSLYVLIGNLIGLTFGPALCAALAERLYAGPDAMRQSLSLMGMVLGPVTAGGIFLAVAGYRRAYAEQDEASSQP